MALNKFQYYLSGLEFKSKDFSHVPSYLSYTVAQGCRMECIMLLVGCRIIC